MMNGWKQETEEWGDPLLKQWIKETQNKTDRKIQTPGNEMFENVLS